ncbi:MAG: glycosyltransferase family 4 protein [Planctomycetes bacterium]|nr:glycosyltransferase family 4 protein [Planctomycetota bacterium]
MPHGKTKRVLFVAYYFPPRGGAGVQRSLKFVKYLRCFGWEPTVLTTEYSRGSGAYDESLLREVPEGTRVVRVPSKEGLFISIANKGLGRLVGLVYRPDAMVTWARKAAFVARELHIIEPFDLVYTSVQPWSAGLVGLWLEKNPGIPWVVDFRDPWTASLHLEWPTRLHWLWDRRLERRFLAAADRTLVVTPTMRDEFLAAHPEVPPDRVKVIYNGFDEDDLTAPAAADDGKFTVVFTGRFQYDHRPEASKESFRKRVRHALTYKPREVRLDTHSPVYFLRALNAFLKRFPDRRHKVRVVFAGTVGEGNLRLIRHLGLDDVVWCPGYIPHRDAVGLVNSADVLLLPMFSTLDPNERVAYASGKVFEYIAARKPVLALVQEGDAKDIVEASGLGVAVGPADVPAITEALESLYAGWESGKAAFAPDEAFLSRFTRESIARELSRTFDEVVAGKEARK